jgi:hypothetical protein
MHSHVVFELAGRGNSFFDDNIFQDGRSAPRLGGNPKIEDDEE